MLHNFQFIRVFKNDGTEITILVPSGRFLYLFTLAVLEPESVCLKVIPVKLSATFLIPIPGINTCDTLLKNKGASPEFIPFF